MIRRHVSFWTPVLLFSGAAFLLLLMLARLAHADPAAAAPSVGLASDAVVWLLGILVALRILEMGLTWLAPRTKTTWDDQLLADVRELRQTGQEILQQVKTPASGIPLGAALVVLLIGALGLQACATEKHVVAAGKDALVSCAKADAGQLLALTAELGSDSIGAALHTGAVDWGALVSKAKAAGVEIGGCAFVAIYHALSSAKPAQAAAPRTADVGPDPAPAALEQLRAALGGGHWQLADGTVL